MEENSPMKYHEKSSVNKFFLNSDLKTPKFDIQKNLYFNSTEKPYLSRIEDQFKDKNGWEDNSDDDKIISLPTSDKHFLEPKIISAKKSLHTIPGSNILLEEKLKGYSLQITQELEKSAKKKEIKMVERLKTSNNNESSEIKMKKN